MDIKIPDDVIKFIKGRRVSLASNEDVLALILVILQILVNKGIITQDEADGSHKLVATVAANIAAQIT